tara:strand:+ start:902 stop:1939 length:1038 start_codon:yes stop_codon:yes gene_type:complete
MKVSIGTKVKEGPWGGGNLFAKNLQSYLQKNGHEVVFDLSDKDIDVILITEPRKTSESSAYTHWDVQKYLSYVNKNTIVVHRINECDERKGTNFVNNYMMSVNKIADYTIYVSSWLRSLYEKQGLVNKESSVILAGADKKIFNNIGFIPWNKNEKLKIVTHHWGASWKKGFDIYKELDELIANSSWSNKIEFSYIGNLPKNFKFKNSKSIPPLSGLELASKIKENHLYLTASINEPSGNHHIEAAQCGLPLLFINSGGIPEYCSKYGLEFNKYNFEEKLNEIYYDYSKYQKKVEKYPNESEKMGEEYLKIFYELLDNKDKIIKTKKFNNNLFEKYLYLSIRKISL